jgi:hypothetical protein
MDNAIDSTPDASVTTPASTPAPVPAPASASSPVPVPDPIPDPNRIPIPIPITLDDLAVALHTTPKIVRSLIGTHITRIDHCHVEMPTPSKLKWLRYMLGPLPERPLIALRDIAARIRVTVERLRDICANCKPKPISVYRDKILGELVAPNHACELIRQAMAARQSFDRISLLMWMCGLDMDVNIRRRPRPYALAIEYEVRRLRKLRDPERTIQALKLLSRYVDAKVVAESVLKSRFPWEAEEIGRQLEKMTGGKMDD